MDLASHCFEVIEITPRQLRLGPEHIVAVSSVELFQSTGLEGLPTEYAGRAAATLRWLVADSLWEAIAGDRVAHRVSDPAAD